jgi:hypothetical protein
MTISRYLMAIVAGVGFALAAMTVSASAAPSAKFIGTWALDLSGMPADPAPPKSVTLTTTDVGGGKWKSSIATVAADGTKSANEVTYAVDGTPSAMTGDENIDSASFTSPDPNTLVIKETKDGKLVTTVTTKLSADGNTQNETTVSVDADGKATTTTGVWHRK